MTRDAFLRTLRLELAGMPPQQIVDIVADYTAHFAESRASGRSEEEVAAALGDPRRIARELRAEAGLRRFEADWSFSNFLTAAIALAGLAFVDIFFLLPLLVVAIFLVTGFAIGLTAIGVVGFKIIIRTLLYDLDGTATRILAHLLVGAGLVSCMLGGGALLLIGSGAGIKMLGRFARLHFRLSRTDESNL